MRGIKKLTLGITILALGISGFTIKKNTKKSEIFSAKIDGYEKNFEQDQFNIIAHRGFSSLEVENTKEAIGLAAEKKYIDGIEMDVRLTKDHKLVLSHADYVTIDNLESVQISKTEEDELLTTSYYHISNSLIKRIGSMFSKTDGKTIRKRQDDLENKEYKITTLKEGIETAKTKKIYLDLKFQDNYDEFQRELKNVLQNFNNQKIVIQSMDLASLLKFKRENPKYNCLGLIDQKDLLPYASSFDQIGIPKYLIKEEEVQELLKQGKEVSVWNINKTEDIDNLVEILGKETKELNFITDYPDTIGLYLEDKFPKQYHKKIKAKKKK